MIVNKQRVTFCSYSRLYRIEIIKPSILLKCLRGN